MSSVHITRQQQLRAEIDKHRARALSYYYIAELAHHDQLDLDLVRSARASAHLEESVVYRLTISYVRDVALQHGVSELVKRLEAGAASLDSISRDHLGGTHPEVISAVEAWLDVRHLRPQMMWTS